ncbi:L-rhamnose-binding lectin SML-like [Hippoglossus hippoglossus]|uniref:L-rhamnose-binding lectin SML-like n=1 Tax=Hippoglossus hippoglossus TaxID=8267 RepID=UPI00148D3B01|nr:L-rhamnose-binding lectin SML-like [Hippoglossus hippoglossus]
MGRDSSPPSHINTGEAVPVTIIAWTGSSKTMLHFRLSTTLLLATICLFQTTVSTETVITCDNGINVQRLSCDTGVVRVDAALYGRSNRETCSAGRPPPQLVNTGCSQNGTVNVMKNRCDGKKVCEINTNLLRTSDPCYGTYKYLETNYTCVPAISVVACEGSSTHLFCDGGQVIFVIGADYGRHDQTTCSYKRIASQLRNVECSGPTSNVADSCNGKNSCTFHASNSVLGDTCGGTYKYLEVAYLCEYPLYNS